MIRDRIVIFLMEHSEGIDDDDLTNELGLSYRQQANSICRQLENEGFLERKYKNGKIHNFCIDEENRINKRQSVVDEKKSEEDYARNWFWEGNVQKKVRDYLLKNSYHIKFFANTAKRQKGVDIIAEKNINELWITAKGYPEGTVKTPASTQASHWFKQAIFDIIIYRSQENDISLGIALPDFRRYHALSNKIHWFKGVSGYKYYWVSKNGEVSVE